MMSRHRAGGRSPGLCSNASRRNFMLAALGVLSLPQLGAAATATATVLAPRRLLSPGDANGRHVAAHIGAPEGGQAVALPMRGHGMLVDPRRPDEVLVIARRPGTTVARVDLREGRIIAQWQAEEDRHFYGHACYSADGAVLFFTENDVATGDGLVTVRDAADLRVLDEYPTHGIGPHELLLLQDGATLAIANGGILTFPETGRVKRNRGRIASSLVYLDSRTGRLLGKYPVSSNDMSLRHLAQSANGRIAAALQFEGDRGLPGVPLLMFHRGEETLRFAHAPQPAWDRMRHYAASVAFDPGNACLALSCPLGNTLACWTDDGAYIGCITIEKVSGIAFDARGGFASNEHGNVFAIELATLSATAIGTSHGVKWDNHLYLG